MSNYNERLDDLTSFMESLGWEFDENGYTFEDNYINFRTANMLRQAITADRKRVALEARIDELNSLPHRSVTALTSSVDQSVIYERLDELKQEEV